MVAASHSSIAVRSSWGEKSAQVSIESLQAMGFKGCIGYLCWSGEVVQVGELMQVTKCVASREEEVVTFRGRVRGTMEGVVRVRRGRRRRARTKGRYREYELYIIYGD